MPTIKSIPPGYHTIQPYLIVDDAIKALGFYAKVFGAKERMRMPDQNGRIAHAEIVIGDSCVMLADEHPQMQAFSPRHYSGSPVTLMIYLEDCDATYKLALELGAKSLAEPEDKFYGDRSAGVEDPFGHKWYLATHVRDVSPEEMKAAMDNMAAS